MVGLRVDGLVVIALLVGGCVVLSGVLGFGVFVYLGSVLSEDLLLLWLPMALMIAGGLLLVVRCAFPWAAVIYCEVDFWVYLFRLCFVNVCADGGLLCI